MLRTRFTELFGVEHPILCASLGPWSSVGLAAAVSNAGAVGSLGTAMRYSHEVEADLAELRTLTDRPFVVNHTVRPLNEEAFDVTLAARPPAISLALGLRRDLIDRARDAGILFVQQVHTVEQAVDAAQAGADVIIAQGAEAGGFGGTVSTMALLPQVVAEVDVPVLAAGGVGDGHTLAAALLLGAAGANVGTSFLAAEEAAAADEWKRAIVDAQSEQAVRVEFADHVFPPAGEAGYSTSPRVLETPFVAEWNARPEDVPRQAETLRDELMHALQTGRAHELIPFAGQTVGLVREILPAAEIVRRMVAGAEDTLRRGSTLVD